MATAVKEVQTEENNNVESMVNEVKTLSEQDNVKAIVEGAVTRCRIENETYLETQKMKHEMEMKSLEISARMRAEEAERTAKKEVWKSIKGFAETAAVMATIVSVVGITSAANRDVELEKIRQGYAE